MRESLRERFLEAVQRSHARYVDTGSRSNEKSKVLNGWVIQELCTLLDEQYMIRGLTETSKGERVVAGKYHKKRVDVDISRAGATLGVVRMKFMMSNYQQNRNNSFEQQMGETANLRESNLVYGHIMLLLHPTPYLYKQGSVKKYQPVTDHTIDRYMRLAQDHGGPQVPDVQCVALFLLSEYEGEILRQCTKEDLSDVSESNFAHLEGKLSIDHFFANMKALVESKYIQMSDA